jgi:hypothetical protein
MATDLEHPLFPAKDENDDPPQVGKINIARFDPIKGTMPFVPRLFDASEIRDLSQIAELYGGGRYELIGRNAEGNRIVAKRVYEIAGDPKPLVAPLPVEPRDTIPAPFHAPPVAPPAQGMSLATVLPILVPVVLQYMQNASAERRAQEAQNQANHLMMMQQQQASSQAFIQAMSNLNTRGNGSSQDFKDGIAFAENMIAAKLEEAEKSGGGEADAAEIMKTIGQAFEVLKLTGGSPPATGGGT